MSITRISRSFRDISLSFDPHPVTKDVPALINERAIMRSIRNLVQTIPTERFFNLEIGSDIRRSLFEFVDFGTASIIKDQILNTISNFEPRVNNVQVEVNPNPDRNEFEVTVVFNIIGQDIAAQQFTFILEATR
jgi:phage baseplate assembly protein W